MAGPGRVNVTGQISPTTAKPGDKILVHRTMINDRNEFSAKMYANIVLGFDSTKLNTAETIEKRDEFVKEIKGTSDLPSDIPQAGLVSLENKLYLIHEYDDEVIAVIPKKEKIKIKLTEVQEKILKRAGLKD